MAQPVWNTPAGTLGSYPFSVPLSYQLVATPVLPAVSVSYQLITGTLPTGISMTTGGLLQGTPELVTQDTTYSFTVRVTDNLSNLRDRTFSLVISGTAVPQFTTPEGELLSTQDSIWVQIPVQYSNPEIDNTVIVELQEGTLPPGLEISPEGLIQGYAQPPTITVTLPLVSTVALTSDALTDYIYVLNIQGIDPGRPVVFSGTVFGDVVSGQTYYVKTVDTVNGGFTITATQNGDTFPLAAGSGSMVVTLPPISQGQPTIRTYSFVLRLRSALGGDIANYSITVINQNTSVSQGGPGNPLNNRVPTILNTRPLTFNLNDNDPYYGYYILPPVSPGTIANIGTIQSDNYFAFKIIGYDFDSNPISYSYSELPTWLSGDPVTGWITGNPSLSSVGINNYSFNVSVFKASSPTISTTNFYFGFNLSKDLVGDITWISNSNLGSIFNGTISTFSVQAISDVELEYRVTSGSLPPNLVLSSNGEILGQVADQPTTQNLAEGANTEFTFTVQAFSDKYPTIQSSKTFTINVLQEFSQPTDILYIKAAPSIPDRRMLAELLDNEIIIPTEYLYRPNDQYFGKASSVIYEHAYGIFASEIERYIEAVSRNHYWRNITLGEIKTASAKNENGDVIYEVVYSEVIDNLVNPKGVSISSEIFWPRLIDLGLGPWYTSITDIYTSYENILGQEYYDSLTPGFARTLYPNSLFNMRNRVSEIVGQEFNSKLLPLWMTSQQENGSTLGYTQAWVICYTKPGFAETVKTNIGNLWNHTLNEINFKIDRFSVNKSATYNYDNSLNPPAWIGLPSGTPVPSPLDSQDFYVLFPRQTILPDETQY
jgi:hypothetical protein